MKKPLILIAQTKTYIALDIGDKKVGVAVANSIARLPRPLGLIERTEQFIEQLKNLISEHQADTLIVGLPRNMSGEETAQTARTRELAEEIEQATGLPIIFTDETLTSQKALEEFKDRRMVYNRGDVDALAATYILEDFLKSQEQA